VKKAETTQQHKSVISAFRVAAPKWAFEQINFRVGNRRSVVDSGIYTKLKKLDAQEGKTRTNRLFSNHVTQVM